MPSASARPASSERLETSATLSCAHTHVYPPLSHHHLLPQLRLSFLFIDVDSFIERHHYRNAQFAADHDSRKRNTHVASMCLPKLCVCVNARGCVSACWGFTVNWRRLLSFYHKSHNGPACLYKTKCFVFLFVFLVKHFIKVLFQRRVNMNLSFGVGIFLRALKAAFHSKMRTCLKFVSIDPLRAVNFILNLASKFYKKI